MSDRRLCVVVTENGRRSEMPLEELVDRLKKAIAPLLFEEIADALRDQGFVSRHDIEAAEARQRDLARLTLRDDRFKVVQ
jgi:hypothetical protein